MRDHYNYIYLSPHLDDVALSCGGQVAQLTLENQSVLIVSLTAGDAPIDNLPPFAQAHHESWQLDANAVADRRAEDMRACRLLGADWVHLDVYDAIYRRHPETGEALYNDDVQLFGAVNSAELPLIKQIAARFEQLPSAEQIVAPLTVGNHVDHQLMRAAAEAAFGPSLVYYEDYPYCQWHGLGDKTAGAWQGEVKKFSAEALTAKLNAIAAYDSQVDHLFKDMNDMHSMVNAYTKHIGGERIWRFTPAA